MSTDSEARKHDLLLVEDDVRLATLVKEFLEQNEFNVDIEYRGDTAVEKFQRHPAELIILDVMLPGIDGLEVCRRIRAISAVPILMLTAKSSDIDQVVGLELGADDYVIKPVEPRVLLARIRALLRRNKESAKEDAPSPQLAQKNANSLIFGELKINRDSQDALLKLQKIDLTTHEFELLWLLASNHGKILSRDDIYSSMKGIDYNGLDRTVDVRISRLRKKLDDNQQKPYRIKTVWGKGYLFVSDAWD